MDEVFTVYKLIILYILERAEGDVTQAMVSSFLLESGYANFVSLAESYDQLEKRGLVKIVSRGEKTFLHPTDAGRQAFGFFGRQLNPRIRSQIDDWLIENGQKIREDRDVSAVYEKMNSGVYEVRMSVKESIAEQWNEKNADIYHYLIENLF